MAQLNGTIISSTTLLGISGIDVVILNTAPGSTPVTVTTVADGTYALGVTGDSMDIPAGDYIVTVDTTGFDEIDPVSPVTVNVPDGGSATKNFQLSQYLKIDKTSNIPAVVVDQVYSYIITVTNTDTALTLQSVVVSDPLDEDINFIEKTVKIDGVTKLTGNIISGVEVGPLGPGESKEITFDVLVVKKTADTINNISTAVYTYYPSADAELETNTVYTSEHIVYLYGPKLVVVKESNKDNVTLDDEIMYTVTVTNAGNTILTDVVYIDKLPNSVELVEGSFTVDGKEVQDVSLEDGVNIDVYNPGTVVNIEYKVKVIGGSCSGYIINCAYGTYRYELPTKVTGTGQSEYASNQIKTDIAIFKQITIDTGCRIPDVKPEVDEMDSVSIEAEITDSYVIKTPVIVTNEDQRLTGYKLVVHGMLNVVLQYTALCRDHSVHSAHYNIPFSSFIILPPDYAMGLQVEVSAIVENADTEIIGKKEVFINVALLLVANIA